MNAEFNWWLLIVGLVLGAALTWLIMADSARREGDLDETERAGEAVWIAKVLRDNGRPVTEARVGEILDLHRDYLGAPPPDDPGQDEAESAESVPAAGWSEPRAEPRRPSDFDEAVDSRG